MSTACCWFCDHQVGGNGCRNRGVERSIHSLAFHLGGNGCPAVQSSGLVRSRAEGTPLTSTKANPGSRVMIIGRGQCNHRTQCACCRHFLPVERRENECRMHSGKVPMLPETAKWEGLGVCAIACRPAIRRLHSEGRTRSRTCLNDPYGGILTSVRDWV